MFEMEYTLMDNRYAIKLKIRTKITLKNTYVYIVLNIVFCQSSIDIYESVFLRKYIK